MAGSPLPDLRVSWSASRCGRRGGEGAGLVLGQQLRVADQLSDDWLALVEDDELAVLDTYEPRAARRRGLAEGRQGQVVRLAEQTGAVVLSSATTVAEARRLQMQGADGIIAQASRLVDIVEPLPRAEAQV